MVKNIISNYISDETLTFHDGDPLQLNKNAKRLILDKNEISKK